MAVNQILRSIFTNALGRYGVSALMFIVFISANSFAQDDKKQSDDQKKQQDKTAKVAEAAAKKQAKDEDRYQKIRTFAENLYSTNPDFKEAVNQTYRDIRQNHTEKAYVVNTRPSNLKLVTQDGDKVHFDDTLYDNPLAQDFVNRVGQSLVPKDSKQLYAFKIIQNPVPDSKAFSNGTIYITTGYLSIIDNEAQLAYILAHEIAHIEKGHWFQDVLVEIGTESYDNKNPLPSFLKKLGNSLLVGYGLRKPKTENVNATIEWEPFQEDEADVESLKYMFGRNYDVREIPKLYERIKELTSDPRSQTGFIGDPQRIRERQENVGSILQSYIKAGANSGAIDLAEKRNRDISKSGFRGIARILNETMAPEIQRKLDSGELMASSEEFQSTMAIVKRDNGLRALQFDIFELARRNLEDSLAIRSNDPYAYYYYGKALKQTARNAADIAKALQNLNLAINADKRQTIAEPYLFRAMLKLGERNPNETPLIVSDLRKYVEIYQRENKGDLPPNMEFVYDFMQDLDVLDYRASPADNTAEAPKSIFGTVSPTGQSSVPQPTNPPVVITQAATPIPNPAKAVKGKKPE